MSLAFLAKKSWHTANLKNVEKVWIAEEKKRKEETNLKEIQMKLEEERANEDLKKMQYEAGLIKTNAPKLDWMYAGPAARVVNNDEYLMGKAIETNDDSNIVKEVLFFAVYC